MTLERFVAELRSLAAPLQDPRTIVERARPFVLDLAGSPGWLEARHYHCDPQQGFGAHLLHEEPDHSLAVIVGAWLPGRGAPPHDHGTWALVAGVEGWERNSLFVRTDDRSRPGHAHVEWQSDVVLGPGDVLTFQADTIHSVVNETDRVSVSLHVYGLHVNHARRSQFDTEMGTEKPFILTID